MKVHKITTKNFLALRDCTIDALDEHLNFFVGPNGSGKTSLFRALRVLKESFEAVGTGKTLDHLYSVHANPRQIDIDVKVSWDTDQEKKAICAFLYASLSTMNPLNEAIKRIPQLSGYQITPEKYERFTGWLREQCTPERLQFLFTGQLHLTYREDTGTRLSYAFVCNGEPVTIQMAAYPPQDGTFWKGSLPISSTTNWRAGSDILLEYLFSAKDSLKQHTRKTKAKTPKKEGVDAAQTPEKVMAEAVAETYFAYTRREKPAPLDMAAFVLDLAEKHGYLEIGTVTESQTYQPEYVLLKELSGMNFSQANTGRLSCSKLFSLLLRNACVFTKSVFAPFEEPVPFDEKRVFPVHKTMIDENDIPYWLLGIRDGTVDEKEQYQRNQARLQANRARADAMGVARSGSALLAGLLVCASCGCRLTVHYDDGGARLHTYECVERWTHYGEPRCQHLAGLCLDAFVSQQVLLALEPAALELSLTATERLEQERAELDRLWQQRRERAAYEVERAARQYHAVEPEHRLVARTLERAWEEKLVAQQQLEEEYHRFVQHKPRLLSETEREAIRHLATDIPALWAAPTTTAADRKEIIRQVVERVIVDVQGSSERVNVRIEWIGGGHTEGVVIRPVGKLSELSTYPQICQLVQELTEAGWAATAIAQALNDGGFRSSRSSTGFRAQTITQLQRQLGVRAPRPRVRQHDSLLPGEWWPTELVRTLGIPRGSLYHWIRQGVVRARQLDEPLHRWVVWADEAEQERLREYHQRAIGDDFRHRWADAPLAEQL